MGGLTRKAAIAGVHEYPSRRDPTVSENAIQALSAKRALEDAGLDIKDVDGLMSPVGMGLLQVAEYMGLNPDLVDSTQVGGSSYQLHVARATAAIAAGQANCIVVTYGSIARSSARAIGTGGRNMANPNPIESFEVPYGGILAGMYAMVKNRHMYEFGTKDEQFANISVITRRHAGLNPEAMFRDPITIDDVLSSRIIAYPLHLLECCIVSDGGGAVVVVSPELARSIRKKPVWVLGEGEGYAHLANGKRDWVTTGAAQSGKTAFAQAGVTHADIDHAMIYDSFTITVLTALEDLGFCAKGEGGAFVEGNRLAIDGDMPMNTDGGGLSSNHPGMRGLFLIVEAVKQLRQDFAGTERQVPGDPKISIAHGTGGMLGSRHASETLVLGV